MIGFSLEYPQNSLCVLCVSCGGCLELRMTYTSARGRRSPDPFLYARRHRAPQWTVCRSRLRRAETLAVVGESGPAARASRRFPSSGLSPSPPGRIVAGRVVFEGRDLLASERRRNARGARRTPSLDDLPGADDLAQSRPDRRPADRRKPGPAPRSLAERCDGEGGRDACARYAMAPRPERRVRQLSA